MSIFSIFYNNILICIIVFHLQAQSSGLCLPARLRQRDRPAGGSQRSISPVRGLALPPKLPAPARWRRHAGRNQAAWSSATCGFATRRAEKRRTGCCGTSPFASSLASALLAPTRIYVKPLLNVIREFEVHGVDHVTGGGFEGNVPRILPHGVRARIDPHAWPRPGVYPWIQRLAELPEEEMLRVFNCGIGMILLVPRESSEDIIHRLQSLGERAYPIGEIVRKASEDEPALWFDPGFARRE